jgi:hypothetical protein
MIAQFGYFLADLMVPITTVINQVASALYFFDGGYGYRRRGNNNYNQGGYP